MAHEQSITLQHQGKWYNIPSVVEGEVVPQDAALNYAQKNKRMGKGFKDVSTAVKAAKKRSKSFNHKGGGGFKGVNKRPKGY